MLMLVLSLGIFAFSFEGDPNYFVLAQGSGIVADNCNAPGGNVEVYIAYNKHSSNTGYAAALIAGRCPVVQFNSQINRTNGTKSEFRADVEQDVRNYIIRNNIKFDLLRFGPNQKIDGRGNFTLP